MHTKLKMFSLAAILLSFNLSAGEPYGHILLISGKFGPIPVLRQHLLVTMLRL